MPRPSNFLFEEVTPELRAGSVVVEIGAIRTLKEACQSTLRWPSHCLVWCIDCEVKHLKFTRELVGPHVQCVLADGLEFLRRYPGPIDLLFLDGPHPDREDGRQWHLQAFESCRSLPTWILIDDTDLPDLGKGQFVIPAALEAGYRIAKGGSPNDRQTLLGVKPC